MDWIRFYGLARAYGARDIFSDIGGVLADDAKIAIVGPNGAGKSSLVRILAGLETPDDGTVIRAKNARLGYLGQGVSGEQAATLREILARGFSHIHAEEDRLRRIERELGDASNAGDSEREAALLIEYGEALESFGRHGGDAVERKMRSMLSVFGFTEADLDRDADSFSGGQRTRVALARMLIDEPDYCILDEPTNHLDLQTVRWLEDFLVEDHRAMLVISHDRYFLDKVATEIWELDGGILERYEVARGRAYSDYVEQKRERAELAQREYENYLAEKKRQKAVIAELRTHGSHNYSHVKSREKAFAKMEEVQAPRTSQQQISVKLQSARRATTGLALQVKHISKQYDAPLFDNVSFDIVRGDRLAIVGPNGAGKSTMLNILQGRLAPDKGSVRIMDGMKIASFAQNSAEELPTEMSAVDAVLSGSKILPQDARGLLGRLGITGDDADKPVEAFSGGERRRIMLARLMAQSADCLFLDEPTNDLDIPSQEALEAVLSGYSGALVVVSHDRYLLRRLSEKVLRIKDGEVTFFEHGYDAYEASEHNQTEGNGKAAAEPTRNASAPAENADAGRRNGKKNARSDAGGRGEVLSNGAQNRDDAKNRDSVQPRDGHNSHGTNQAANDAPQQARKTAAQFVTEPAAAVQNGSQMRSGTGQPPARKRNNLDRDLKNAEAAVARLDARKAELEVEYADPRLYENPERQQSLDKELTAVTRDVEAAYAKWEALSAEAEAFA